MTSCFKLKFFLLVISCLFIGLRALSNNCLKRNLTAARDNNHICQNSCRDQTSCISSARKCVCDGVCGASCVRKLLKCAIVEQPINGRVRFQSGNRFNSKAVYSCNRGYQLVGDEIRYCRGHGKYDKKSPICKKIASDNFVKGTTEKLVETTTNGATSVTQKFIGVGIWDSFQIIPEDNASTTGLPEFNGSLTENKNSSLRLNEKFEALDCNEPPTIRNSIVPAKFSADFPIGLQVEYKCNYGFFASSKYGTGQRIISTTQCMADYTTNSTFWTPLNFECREKSCPDPGNILNGVRDGYLITVGNEVRYKCDEGYRLIGGHSIIFCTPSGTWNKQPPSCKVVECPAPEKPEDIAVAYDSTIYKSTATYSCSRPFTLLGDRQRTCLVNGTWSGKVPTCQVAKCVPPELLPNGDIIVGNGPIVVGYTIFFKCKNQGVMVGSSTSYCMENGLWAGGLPECKVTCRTTRVANGQFYNENLEMILEETEISHHEKLTLGCNDGFEVSRTDLKFKELVCRDGIWSSDAQCVPAGCFTDDISSFRPVGGTTVNLPAYNKLYHNTKFQMECRYGYYPREPFYIVCEFGTWKWLTGEAAKCTPEPCTISKSDLGDSEYVGLWAEKRVPHGTLEIKCADYRYELPNGSPSTVNCVFGDFETSFPECRPKSCQSVIIANGHDIDKASHNTEWQITCSENYAVLEGTSHVTCQYGHWSPEIPTCVKVNQVRPSPFSKIKEDSDTNMLELKTCLYNPFVHVNVYTDVLAGADVTKHVKIYSGTVVKSRCRNRTFFKKKFGTDVAVCQDGIWSPEEPLSCQAVEAGDIITPFYAKKTKKWYSYKEYGGHDLSVENVIVVKLETTLHLQCRLVDFQSHPVWYNNVRKPLTSVFVDKSWAVYKMSSTTKENAGDYVCWIGGKASKVTVKVVEEFRCPEEVPWQSTGLMTEFDGYQTGALAQFSCESGYIFEGETEASCNDKHLWETDDPPRCKSIPGCQKPNIQPDSNYGEMDAFKDRYDLGERITFSCKEGYVIQEPYKSIQCTPSGWTHQDPPTCMTGCQLPDIHPESNLLLQGSKKVSYSLGDIVRFSCKSGYRINELHKAIQCWINGWNKKVPTCVLISKE